MFSPFPMTWQVMAVVIYALILCGFGFYWQAVVIMLAVNYVSDNQVLYIVCFFAMVSGMLGWLRAKLTRSAGTSTS